MPLWTQEMQDLQRETLHALHDRGIGAVYQRGIAAVTRRMLLRRTKVALPIAS